MWFEIHINPLLDTDNGLLRVSTVFFDVTATRAWGDKVVAANRQLEAAYEELHTINVSRAGADRPRHAHVHAPRRRGFRRSPGGDVPVRPLGSLPLALTVIPAANSARRSCSSWARSRASSPRTAAADGLIDDSPTVVPPRPTPYWRSARAA